METQFIFSSGALELKTEGEDFYVEGYISTSDKDLVNDIVTKNCILDMGDQMRARTIKLDIEHETFRGKSEIEAEINKTLIPAAKIEDFLIDKKGLKVRAMLNRHVPRFQELKNSIKDGFIDAFSIAFVPVKDTIEEKGGEKVRLLEKINLLNVAFTGNPINTHASIEKVFMKSLDFLKEKNNHANDAIKLQEVKNMTEENKKNQEVAETEEPKVEETKEEPVEAVEEPVVEEPKEEPKVEDTEVKNLKAEVKSLKEDLAEVKSILAKPVKKSIMTEVDKTKNFEDKSSNPLDLI